MLPFTLPVMDIANHHRMDTSSAELAKLSRRMAATTSCLGHERRARCLSMSCAWNSRTPVKMH